jgi:HPt (histidine-containing phosphotransfer) domain-containing protein
MGGDYKDVLNRLMSDKMVAKFLPKVLSDQSYDALCRALDNQDVKEGFKAAHTMKGVCQNMSLTKLSNSVSELTEALRNRETYGEDLMPLYLKVKQDYAHTCECIRKLVEEQ